MIIPIARQSTATPTGTRSADTLGLTCTKTADAVTLTVDGREVACDDEAIGELSDGGDITVRAHSRGFIRPVRIATSVESREKSE